MSYVLKLLFSRKQYTDKNDRNRQERWDAGNSLCEYVSLHHYQAKLLTREFQDLRAWFCKAMSALASLQQRPQHMHHFNYTSTPIKMDLLISLKLSMGLSANLRHWVSLPARRTARSGMLTHTNVDRNRYSYPKGPRFVFFLIAQVSIKSSSAEAKQGSRLWEDSQRPLGCIYCGEFLILK